MKIAAVTADGKTISHHFGRAPYYLVVTTQDSNIIHRDMRDKLCHARFQEEEQTHDEESGERHGYGPAADSRHARMLEAITDCEAVLCRSMGMGAYESMKARGIRPVVTDIADIDEAVRAYVSGQIIDHVEKLH